MATLDDPVVARRGFDEARSMWQQLGNPLGEARVELTLARISDGAEGVRLAESAASRFRSAGARAAASDASALAAATRDEPKRDAVARVLGAFSVMRDGHVIGSSEWGSRKPRDLLKVLLARRRGPVRRDALLDELWPDDDPVATSRKLSVALSTLRAILDPRKAHPPDHLVAADRNAVWLVADHWDIDLDRFLRQAADGLRLHAAADDHCIGPLTAAEAMYVGDPFEEDAYEAWAQTVRDAARATHVAVMRALAGHAAHVADHDTAGRMLLRLLERDPFDEGAHLGLVRSLRAAGRHGEAHRAYRTYCERMEEIGVEASPFPTAPGR